ncbi:hypothetical protein HKCCSP123_12750 [Rhodobacterales bacterium HKCCSP123]|nr:hypothetical protein [Rhodobacterales bacterium HKCCSP123]
MSTRRPPVCFVVTHHKTGTVWMRRVFQRIAKDCGIGLANAFNPSRVEQVLTSRTTTGAFLVSTAGKLPDYAPGLQGAWTLHLIRDPRDILLSGLHYHLRHVPTDRSPERAIHRPRESFDGMSYQQKLRSLPGLRHQMLFEMRHRHALTVREILGWDYDAPRRIEWRYEAMMQDRTGQLFHEGMRRMGWPEPVCDLMRQAFLSESLFGSRSDRSAAPSHVTSGKVTRWPDEFTRAFGEIYEDAFGHALRQLAYETDAAWLDRLA